MTLRTIDEVDILEMRYFYFLLWTETLLLHIWTLKCYRKSSSGPWRFCDSPLPSKGWNYISPSKQDMDKLRRIFGIENPYKTKKLFVYKYALELVLTFLLIWIIGVWNGFFLVTIKICAYLSNFASGFPKVPFCITFSNKGNWKRLLWLPGCFILSFQYYFV